MMQEKHYVTNAGEVAVSNAFGDELSAATAQTCQVSITRGVDENGQPDPTKDRLRVLTANASPEDSVISAAVAAYPVAAPPLTGSFAITKNTPVKALERFIAPGQHFVLDVHVHASLGTVSSSADAYTDVYACAWRDSTGGVQTTGSGGVTESGINGFKVRIETTADTVYATIETRKSGTLTIHSSSMDLKSTGTLS